MAFLACSFLVLTFLASLAYLGGLCFPGFLDFLCGLLGNFRVLAFLASLGFKGPRLRPPPKAWPGTRRAGTRRAGTVTPRPWPAGESKLKGWPHGGGHEERRHIATRRSGGYAAAAGQSIEGQRSQVS